MHPCFCCYGYIFRKISWHILPIFFTLVFAISLVMVKTDVKIVFWRVFFFSRTGLSFFSFFRIYVIYLLVRYILYVFWVFDWSSDRASQLWLCGLTGISPNQKQLELTLRFSSGLLNLSRKVPIKQITYAEKLPKMC